MISETDDAGLPVAYNWDMGPGPGPSYLESTHKHEWSRSTGETAATNLVAFAEALQARPISPPG